MGGLGDNKRNGGKGITVRAGVVLGTGTAFHLLLASRTLRPVSERDVEHEHADADIP